MNQPKTVTITEIDSVITKALVKLRKINNPSEQNSGLGLVNKASKLAKAYAAQVADAKAQEKYERIQAYKMRRLQQQEELQA